MMMKYITITITILFFGISSYAQKNGNINPFTYGKKVKHIDDNFENLFRNVNQIVDNPDSIQFLGYDYIGTVRDIGDAKKYLSENFHVGAINVGFHVTDTKKRIDKNGHLEYEPVRYIKIVPNMTPDIEDNKSRLEDFVNHFAKQIAIGNKVYQIHFILNHKKSDYNVFINPKTKQVMTTYNNFLLPLTKADWTE